MAENKKYEAELSDEELDQAAGGVQMGVSMNRGLADAAVRSQKGVSLSERARTEGLEASTLASAVVLSKEAASAAAAVADVNSIVGGVQQSSASVNTMKKIEK